MYREGLGSAAVLVVSVLLASPCRGAEPEERASAAEGASTPQGTWEKARAAYRHGDFRSYFDAIAPEAHDECLCDVSFLLSEALGSGLLGNPDQRQELNGILRRYKAAEVRADGGRPVDADAPGLFGRKAIHAISDKAGLYVELMGWLASHRIGARVPAWLAADLTSLTVTGATATATASGGVKKVVHFEKVGETWKIHLPPVCLNDLFR